MDYLTDYQQSLIGEWKNELAGGVASLNVTDANHREYVLPPSDDDDIRRQIAAMKANPIVRISLEGMKAAGDNVEFRRQIARWFVENNFDRALPQCILDRSGYRHSDVPKLLEITADFRRVWEAFADQPTRALIILDEFISHINRAENINNCKHLFLICAFFSHCGHDRSEAVPDVGKKIYERLADEYPADDSSPIADLLEDVPIITAIQHVLFSILPPWDESDTLFNLYRVLRHESNEAVDCMWILMSLIRPNGFTPGKVRQQIADDYDGFMAEGWWEPGLSWLNNLVFEHSDCDSDGNSLCGSESASDIAEDNSSEESAGEECAADSKECFIDSGSECGE